MLAIPRKSTETLDVVAPLISYLTPLGASGPQVSAALTEFQQVKTILSGI